MSNGASDGGSKGVSKGATEAASEGAGEKVHANCTSDPFLSSLLQKSTEGLSSGNSPQLTVFNLSH